MFQKIDLPTCLCHILSVWLFNDRGHLAFGHKFAVRKTCFNFNRRAWTEMWGIGGPDPHGKSQAVGFLGNTSMDPLPLENHKAASQHSVSGTHDWSASQTLFKLCVADGRFVYWVQ